MASKKSNKEASHEMGEYVHPKSNILTIKEHKRTLLFQIPEIEFIVADGAYSSLYYQKKQYAVKRNLKNFAILENLPGFYRFSRSLIFNINKIDYITLDNQHSRTEIVFLSGKSYAITTPYLRTRLYNFLEQSTYQVSVD